MLNLFKLAFALERRQSPVAMRREARIGTDLIGTISPESCPELRIRNLLDDPALRGAMHAELPVPVTPLPVRKRRRPVDRVAA